MKEGALRPSQRLVDPALLPSDWQRPDDDAVDAVELKLDDNMARDNGGAAWAT